MDATATLIFIMAAFSLGAVVVMKKDSIPASMRRGIALTAILLIAFAFFLIVYSFLTLDS
ncbi:MAG TPA: hypothetical protein VMS09_16310 [Paenibacillus sp.]|uniref:hypothetical protein n=1 Tax=Paenibacillus sp. TaxID=58172 RepID=UPI0028D8F0DF|nr:hypothetical protein [Paenibacillus sp.]HUC93555.1 hypothetical protein [Paenibacillus sp.]